MSVKKIYKTHDNGSTPFLVTVEGKNISIAKTEEPEKSLFNYKANEIFIGKKSPTGGYNGLTPKQAEGNSILLRVGETYIFVGHEIFSFTPMAGDSIESFYSNIGHSDVPYPYAIGKNYVYILLEKVVVEKAFFNMKKDIYEQYYFVKMTLDMCLRGYGNPEDCKDKKEAREQIKKLKESMKKMKTKLLQKRL